MSDQAPDTTDTVQDSTDDQQPDAQPDAEAATDAGDAAEVQQADQGEGDTFPRAYVEQLRQENADARVKAKRADVLAERLHGALVAATGRLADPTDLAYDETHLDDPDALAAAVDDLLNRKPHLASRKPRGDIGQGASVATSTVDLAGLLRARA